MFWNRTNLAKWITHKIHNGRVTGVVCLPWQEGFHDDREGALGEGEMIAGCLMVSEFRFGGGHLSTESR